MCRELRGLDLPRLPRAAGRAPDGSRVAGAPLASGEPDSGQCSDGPPRDGPRRGRIPRRSPNTHVLEQRRPPPDLDPGLRGSRHVVSPLESRKGDSLTASRGPLPHPLRTDLGRLGVHACRPPRRRALLRGRRLVVARPGRPTRGSHRMGPLPRGKPSWEGRGRRTAGSRARRAPAASPRCTRRAASSHRRSPPNQQAGTERRAVDRSPRRGRSGPGSRARPV